MSRAAVSYFILAIMALAVDQLLPSSMETTSLIIKLAAGTFGLLLVFALVVGRRIKFDPVLR